MNVCSRKTMGRSAMTRKDALEKVIEMVRKSNEPDEYKAEMLEALKLCLSELPYTRWSRSAILDACAQHLKDKGTLTINDFVGGDLPSHTVIKLKFGMTVVEFREKYFPHWDQRPVYPTEQVFLDEYARIRPLSRKDYDYRRAAGTPVVTTILERLGIKTWTELKRTYNLPTYKKQREAGTYSVSIEHAVDRFDREHERG